MRATALALSFAIGACAGSKNDLGDPKKAFHALSVYGTAQHISGDLLGMRADPISGMQAPAGVPYTERGYDLGSRFEFFPGETSVLGASLGMTAAVNLGYVAPQSIDGMATPDSFLPIRMGMTTGTALAVVRRPGLMLALHTGIKLGIEPERLGDTAEAALVVSAGGRAYFDAGRLRTHLGYDFVPFWGGESRLEHRVSGLFSTKPKEDGWAYGVRAAVALGQKRLEEGGLNDVSFTLGLELTP